MKNLLLAVGALSVIVFHPTEYLSNSEIDTIVYAVSDNPIHSEQYGLDPYTWCKQNTDCYKIAEAVYHEARSEGHDGMVAVANVIMNRANHQEKSPYEIITARKQFSYLDLISDLRMKETKYKKIALRVAYQAVHGALVDITDGATFYYSTSVLKKAPYWASSFEYVADISNHRFYRK